MYDSGASWQYSLIPRFSTIDPLAEKYYHLSPYAYCAGDPVNLIDPDGKCYCANWLSYSRNCLYVAYLFQVLADVLYILHIVYINPESAFEDSVVALNVHLLDVGIELL